MRAIILTLDVSVRSHRQFHADLRAMEADIAFHVACDTFAQSHSAVSSSICMILKSTPLQGSVIFAHAQPEAAMSETLTLHHLTSHLSDWRHAVRIGQIWQRL